MKRKYYAYLILFVFLFFSCSEKKQTSKAINTISEEQNKIDLSGFYIFSSNNKYVANIKSKQNPFGVFILDTATGKEVKWLYLSDYFKNELYGDSIGDIKLAFNNDCFEITYFDEWNELFEILSIKLETWDVQRKDVKYSKQLPEEVKNDIKINKHLNPIKSYIKVRDLGISINYGRTKERYFSIADLSDKSERIGFENVSEYIFNESKNNILLLRNPDAKKLNTLSLVKLENLECSDIGHSYNSPILSSDGNYFAYKTFWSEKNKIDIISLESNEVINQVYYEDLEVFDFKSCDLVSFDYPNISVLYSFENTNDIYVEINLFTNLIRKTEVNIYKDYKIEGPSLH